MTSTGTTYDVQQLQSILSQLQKNTYNSSGYLEVYVTNESSLSNVDITSPLVNGRVAVELNASTTVAASQSGTWTVDAVQSGTWTVGISGTVTVSGTVDAAQSGSWTVSVSSLPNVTIGSPLSNGRVAVELNASTTVAATQSGTWSVDAVQSGTWTVGVSGTVTVSGTVDAAQSGSWTVAATQSGSWTVSASQSGTWTVGLSSTTLTMGSLTGTSSSTADTATALTTTSTLCTHFQIAVTAADLVYLGNSSNQAIPLYEYGIFAFDCNPNETIDLSDWYIKSASTSVPYTVIYQST